MKKLLILAAAVMMAGAVSAQKFQLGVRADIFSQNVKLEPHEWNTDLVTDSKLGWDAAFVTRIKLVGIGKGALGMGLFLQPELVYSHNNYTIQEPAYGEAAAKIGMSDLILPILVSFKVSVVRVQVGPAFNLVHKTSYDQVDGRFSFTKPTIGYTVGASVDLWKGLVLDGRYNGQFKKEMDYKIRMKYSPQTIKGTLSSWSVGLSWLFNL